MSRDAPARPELGTKTLLAAGTVAPVDTAAVEIVAPPRKRSAKANVNAKASASAQESERTGLGATGPRAAPAALASQRPAKAKPLPTLLIVLVVLGACAFAGAYFGSKGLARRDLAQSTPSSSAASPLPGSSSPTAPIATPSAASSVPPRAPTRQGPVNLGF